MASELPELDAVKDAARKIAPFIRHTPVKQSQAINQLLGCHAYFKCENLQPTGAFKLRGASNAVVNLIQSSGCSGVITHSSGNHAAALAYAAQRHQLPCHVVMPEDAPQTKQAAVRRFGASMTLCKPGMAAREKTTSDLMQYDPGLQLVHPYDDFYVIAGQGTATLEFLQQQHELDMLVTPIGGGGLISGAGIVIKVLKPEIQLVGVEPSAVDEARRSLETGVRLPATGEKTIADGLQAGIGEMNFKLLSENVDEVLAVTEQAIKNAMKLIHEHLYMMVEPSAAVGLAAALSGKLDTGNRQVGFILTGGNIDQKTFHNLI